jgi:glycosyltransferase involved in cell wall biosynthesis
MTRCVFAIPGPLSTPAGSYTYARKVLPHLAELVPAELLSLPASFPFPSRGDLDETAGLIAKADRPGTVFLIDSLAYGALPAALIATVKSPIAALVHHPLGLEAGLSLEQKQQLIRSEKEALGLAKKILVPSRGTAEDLQRLFGISEDRIVMAFPGILRGSRASGTPAGRPLHIVSAGSLTPRKGFAVLIDALNEIRDLDWRATIAGSPGLSPKTAAEVYERVASHGLESRVSFPGQLAEEALSALYTSGDIFALATYYEGYGMALAEAMAHGLPIVTSGDGAVADTVPPSCGYVCAAGGTTAIAGALRALICDAPLRKAIADAALRHGQTLPSWRDTAATLAGATLNL